MLTLSSEITTFSVTADFDSGMLTAYDSRGLEICHAPLLLPGRWTVTVDGNTIGSFEATKEGGMLTFTAPAGEVIIAPIN